MATLGSPVKARGSMWRAGALSIEQTQFGVFGQDRNLPSTRPRFAELLAMMLNHLQLSGRFPGRRPEVFAISVDEVGQLAAARYCGPRDHPRTEPGYVRSSVPLLDADQTHLVQIYNGHKIAISP